MNFIKNNAYTIFFILVLALFIANMDTFSFGAVLASVLAAAMATTSTMISVKIIKIIFSIRI